MSERDDRIARNRAKRAARREKQGHEKAHPKTPTGTMTLTLGGNHHPVTVENPIEAKPKPKKKVRLRPWHVAEPDKAPAEVKGEVANARRVAEGVGIPLDKITVQVAEYIIKGHLQYAKSLAEKAA